MSNNPFHPFFGYNRGYDPDMDQVALFIDWDNLVISNYADRGVNRPDLELIVRKAQQYGTLVMARAYAEWQVLVDRLEVYKAGVEPIYAPVFHSGNDLSGQMGRGKSLADPIMVTDCIDFLHLMPQIGTYVLVTGDKDMMPVVRLAKMRGRRVIVIGPDYVANVLQQVSDEFIPYRTLLAQGAYEQYAAYGYTPNGTYPPQVGASQLPQQNTPYVQNNFAQQTTTAQNANDRDRRGRRLTGSQTRTRTGQSSYSSQPAYNQTPMPPTSYQAESIAAYPPQPAAYQQYQGQQIPSQVVPGQIPPQIGSYGTQPSYNQPSQYAGQVSDYSTPVAPISGVPAYQGYQPAQPVVAPAPAYQQPSYVPAPLAQPKTSVANEQFTGSSYAIPPTVIPTIVAVPPVEIPRGKAANDFEEIKELVRNILLQKSAAGRGHLRARDLKEEILRRLPNFSERRYGFSKFKAMLSAIEQSGVIQTEQADHIVWVSLPGSPKLPPEVMSDLERQSLNPGGSIMTDDSEDEGDENEDRTESPVLEAATATEPTGVSSLPAIASEESNQEELEAAVQAPEPAQAELRRETAAVLPNRVAEERKTSLTEAPIGAHRETPQRSAAQFASLGSTGPTFPELGPKPALLEQPYYQEVIVLIDSLRYRNRWLGYELLLSNIRDYLSKQMSESEAKNLAGTILPRLLSEGVLKSSQEIHSRGPRKMRVLVQHLQEENRAVKYALAAAKLAEQQRKAQATAQAAEAVESQTATGPRQTRVHRLILDNPQSEAVEQALTAETAAIAAPATDAQPAETVSEAEVVAESPALPNEAEMPSSMLPTSTIEEQTQSQTEAYSEFGTAPEAREAAAIEPASSFSEASEPPQAQPISYDQLVEAAAPHDVTADTNPQQTQANETSDNQIQTEMQSQDNIPGIDFTNRVEQVNVVEQELLQRAAEMLVETWSEVGEPAQEVVVTLVETVPQPSNVGDMPMEVVLVSTQAEITEEPGEESDEVEAEQIPVRRPRRRRSSPTVHKIPTDSESL